MQCSGHTTSVECFGHTTSVECNSDFGLLWRLRNPGEDVTASCTLNEGRGGGGGM